MWDERYNTDDYVYGTEPNAFLAEGEGRNAVFLAEQGYQATGLDASAVGFRKAAQLAQQRGVDVRLSVTDLVEADLGEACWDGVVYIFAHLPPDLRRSVHRRVVHALKPGGVLLLEAYTPAQLGRGTGGPPDAAMMMTAAILRKELPGLEFLLLRECEREIIEGQGHTGTGAVVQAIARKP